MDIIRISPDCTAIILQHVSSVMPEEACGILAGKNNQINKVISIENRMQSPFRFSMDARAQFDAFRTIEQEKLELLGIYHSHPEGPSKPSETDIREHAYGDVLSIICSPDDLNGWKMMAFSIIDGTAAVREMIY